MPHPKGQPLSETTKARLREANLRRLEDPAERERCRAQMLHARSFKRHGNRVRVDPASLAPVMEAVGRVEAQLQRIGDMLAGRPAEAPGWAPWAPWPGETPGPASFEAWAASLGADLVEAGKQDERPVLSALGGAVPLGVVAPVASAIGPAIVEAMAPTHPEIPESSPAEPLTGWALKRLLPGATALYWTGETVAGTDIKGRPARLPQFGTAAQARPFPDRAAAAEHQRWHPELRGLTPVDLEAEAAAHA